MLVMAISAMQGFAQLTSSDLEAYYGRIRADIVKDACKISGYNNKAALDKIKDISLDDFYKELKNDTCNEKSKKLYSILKLSHKSLSGTEVSVYDSLIKTYRNDIEVKLLEIFPDKRSEILTMGKYIPRIQNLTEECNCFNRGVRNNFSEYRKNYPKGLFTALIKNAKQTKEDVVTKEGNGMSSILASICKNSFLFLEIVLAAIVLLAVGFVGGILYKKRKKTKEENKRIIDDDLPMSNPVLEPAPQTPPTQEGPIPVPPTPPTQKKPTPVPVPHASDSQQGEGKELVTPTTETTPEPPQKASYNAFSEDAGNWVVVGASVQGNGHISMNLPCQDSCGYKYLNEGWGIAVTSDGAGSAKNSQVGSAIAVQRAIFHFENLIKKENWITKNTLPTESQWIKYSYKCLKLIHDEIEAFSKKKNVDFKSLSSTIIVVIHTPLGLLACHIGDGRAGYMDMEGQWHSLMTPHKGEETNQTIFIPSEFWNIPFYEMSGAVVPEARIITGKVSAFTLMSDGCESTSWQCNYFNKATGKYYDPNIPHKPFFDSIVETLKSFRKDGMSHDERKNKWAAFIKDGNKSFIKESDDKTMIVGALYI